jgi:hypothetical protein
MQVEFFFGLGSRYSYLAFTQSGSGRARNSSQIDDDVTLRLRATDQHISVRGCINRVGLVVDRPAHKSVSQVWQTQCRLGRDPRLDRTPA